MGAWVLGCMGRWMADAIISIVWGMKGLRRSKKWDRYIPNKHRGTVRWHNDMDLSDPQAQLAVVRACKSLRSWECKESGCQFDLLVRPNTTECFMEEFMTWHKKNYNVSSLNATSSEFFSRLKTFRRTETPKIASVNSDWEGNIGFIDGDLRYADPSLPSPCLPISYSASSCLHC